MPFPTTGLVAYTTEHTVSGRVFLYVGKQRWEPRTIAPTIVQGGGGSSVPTILDRGNAGTAITFDVNAADIQYATLNSSACTISFTGLPTSGQARWCQLHLVHDATANARAITWSGISWNNGSTPYHPEIQASARTTIEVLTLPTGLRLGYHSANF